MDMFAFFMFAALSVCFSYVYFCTVCALAGHWEFCERWIHCLMRFHRHRKREFKYLILS